MCARFVSLRRKCGELKELVEGCTAGGVGIKGLKMRSDLSPKLTQSATNIA